ncbi:MAG: COG1361 S-layer family protein [Candidatus Aenigmatarchaeota archaeon]
MKINEKSKIFLSSFMLFLFIFTFSTVSASTYDTMWMDLVLVRTEPAPLETGEYANVWVKLINKGDKIAENTTIELIPEFPFKADPDEELVKNFGDIQPLEEYRTDFQIRIDQNAVQGENELKFKIRHDDLVITKYLDVEVRTDDTALIVENVSLDSETIAPSKTEEVEIKLKNLADAYLKNIDVSLDLSSEDIPLITIGSSTVKRIQKIGPGKSASVKFDLKASASADQKAYKVPINIEFENDAGTSFSKEEYTGIIIGGEPELEINLAKIDGGFFKAGTTKEISISLINRGLSSAKFVNMELLDGKKYKVVTSPKVYVGNMESDDYESSSFDVYIEEGVDEIMIPVKLTYKNSEGNSIEETHSMNIETYDDSEISKFNLVKSNGTLYMIVILVIVLLVGFFGYRKWKSKKVKLEE